MTDKQCRALTKNGDVCINSSAVDGLCMTHFHMEGRGKVVRRSRKETCFICGKFHQGAHFPKRQKPYKNIRVFVTK